MSLGEFISCLERFDCDALRGFEVAHYFVTSNGYGYEEVIKGVKFDTKNKRFVIECEEPKEALWREEDCISVNG